MITWENYEEYIMMHADGELSPAEEQALMAFIAAHPELKGELAAYDATRVTPDTTLVYADKAKLMKESAAKRVIALPVWGRYSIAACIAALIFVSVLKYKGTNSEVTEVASKTAKQQPSAADVDSVVKKQVAATTVQEKKEEQTSVAPVVTPALQQEKTAKQKAEAIAVQPVKTPGVEKEQVDRRPHAAAQNVVKELPMASLPVAEIKNMQQDVTKPATATIKEVPAYAVTQNNTNEKHSLLDRLPIDEIKKKTLGNVVTAISDTYNDIGKSKQGDDKTFSIKVEKRKLVLSF